MYSAACSTDRRPSRTMVKLALEHGEVLMQRRVQVLTDHARAGEHGQLADSAALSVLPRHIEDHGAIARDGARPLSASNSRAGVRPVGSFAGGEPELADKRLLCSIQAVREQRREGGVAAGEGNHEGVAVGLRGFQRLDAEPFGRGVFAVEQRGVTRFA